MNMRNQGIEVNEPSASAKGLTRRDLLVRAAAGGGLMVGSSVPGLGLMSEANAATTAPAYNVTAWVVIQSDGTVTIQVPVSEMGQGSATGLAQFVADELRVEWNRIAVVHAPVDAAHGGTNAGPYGRFTGGSLGIRLFAPALQQAGANARQLLIQAAAQIWAVSPAGCTADKGLVKELGGAGRQLSYGTLASTAAGLTLAGNVALNQYPRLFIGQPATRLDIPAKVDGSAQFGIDVFLPGMVFAAVKHCPTLGGTVGAVGGKPAGALAVVPVGAMGSSGATGVAVVAATTWDAMKAAKSVTVNWNLPADAASKDSTAISARATWLMANGTPITAQSVNAAALASGLGSSNAVIDASYQLPFLAHATMEPLNCTAHYAPATATTPATCKVWAPTQGPDAALQTVRALCPAGTQVTLTNTLLGGGFGRKFEQDFVREAVQVALACPGKPVKLTWPREQDFTNDMYRPMALSRIQAGASSAGKITAWKHRVVTPSISAQRGGSPTALDSEAVHGAADLPYALDPILVEYVRHDTTIPVGYWRSVGMSSNTFAVESAIDELAAAVKWDPIEFRLNNLPAGRMKNVLTALKTLSGWTTTPASGRARGVAIAAGFGSYVGQVAEISVNATTGAVTVHRVSTVIDCGLAVNPNAVQAQIEGAVAQAMAATLWDQQTFVNGVPQVTNFNRYRPVRLSEMPQVDVQIINGGAPVGGVGEPGVPCVAPAIANAHARLLGQAARKRSLPFFPGTTLGGL